MNLREYLGVNSRKNIYPLKEFEFLVSRIIFAPDRWLDDPDLINIKEKTHGKSLLHHCAPYVKNIKKLISIKGIEKCIDKGGKNPIHSVVYRFQILKYILDPEIGLPWPKPPKLTKNDIKSIINSKFATLKPNDGWTVLHALARAGEPEILKHPQAGTLINNKVDGYTALHIFSYESNSKNAKLALRHKNLLNVHDKCGWTALHWLAARDCIEALDHPQFTIIRKNNGTHLTPMWVLVSRVMPKSNLKLKPKFIRKVLSHPHINFFDYKDFLDMKFKDLKEILTKDRWLKLRKLDVVRFNKSLTRQEKEGLKELPVLTYKTLFETARIGYDKVSYGNKSKI